MANISKPIKLPKDTQGFEYYPATVTDAVVHPGLRKSLTDVIEELENKINDQKEVVSTPVIPVEKNVWSFDSDAKVGSLAALYSPQTYNISTNISFSEIPVGETTDPYIIYSTKLSDTAPQYIDVNSIFSAGENEVVLLNITQIRGGMQGSNGDFVNAAKLSIIKQAGGETFSLVASIPVIQSILYSNSYLVGNITVHGLDYPRVTSFTLATYDLNGNIIEDNFNKTFESSGAGTGKWAITKSSIERSFYIHGKNSELKYTNYHFYPTELKLDYINSEYIDVIDSIIIIGSIDSVIYDLDLYIKNTTEWNEYLAPVSDKSVTMEKLADDVIWELEDKSIPVVDSVDKLDLDSPQGSLTIISPNIVKEFNELYQPTAEEILDSNGNLEITNISNLSRVKKLIINDQLPINIDDEFLSFVVLLSSKDFKQFISLTYDSIYVNDAVSGERLSQSFNVQNDGNTITINVDEGHGLEALILANELMSSYEMLYIGTVADSDQLTLMPELVPYVDMFYNIEVEGNSFNLYVKKQTGWEQYSELVDGSVTMDKLADDVKSEFVSQTSLESTLSDFSKTDHTHDDYVTSSSLEGTLSDYSKTNHNHDDKYMGITTQVNGTVGDVVITNMVPNKLYRYVGGGCTSITVNSLSSVVAGNYNEYMLEFEAGNGCTFVWPETLKWMNGQEPVFESSKIYQISIVNNLGVYAQF